MEYYVTTLSQGGGKLLSLLAFLGVGYIIFFKMPFFFLRKNLLREKAKMSNLGQPLPEEKKTTPKILRQDEQLKINKQQDKAKGNFSKQDKFSSTQSQDKTDHFKKDQKRQEQTTRQREDSPKKSQTPEEIFNLKKEEVFTKEELKKRYLNLLKQNHPDRVASMGEDFKKLAEKNTKEINDAYEKLKAKL